jgi:hypothetical protein
LAIALSVTIIIGLVTFGGTPKEAEGEKSHDLQDLKELIQLILTTIQSELKLRVPRGKK